MAGKRDRFAELYYRYYPVVMSAVYYRARNYHDAEEITQEVFLRFYRKMDEVESPGKWLMGTLRNVMYEYYRKNRPESFDIEEMMSDVSLTFVNGLRETRIIVDDALRHLEGRIDEGEQAVFDLVAVYGYSYREAGKSLGMTKRMVEYRYRRIVSLLLDYLRTARGITSFEDLL
jgi:RNA polymerase sigma factor (sigma-70 family)